MSQNNVIWDNQNAAHTAYKNFLRYLTRTAQDQWDLINVLDKDKIRYDNDLSVPC